MALVARVPAAPDAPDAPDAEAFPFCVDMIEVIAGCSLPAFLAIRRLCREFSQWPYAMFLHAAVSPADFSQRLKAVLRLALAAGQLCELAQAISERNRDEFRRELVEAVRGLLFVAAGDNIADSVREKSLATVCGFLLTAAPEESAQVRELFAAPYRTLQKLPLLPATWLGSVRALLDGLLVDEFAVQHVILSRTLCEDDPRSRAGAELIRKEGKPFAC